MLLICSPGVIVPINRRSANYGNNSSGIVPVNQCTANYGNNPGGIVPVNRHNANYGNNSGMIIILIKRQGLEFNLIQALPMIYIRYFMNPNIKTPKRTMIPEKIAITFKVSRFWSFLYSLKVISPLENLIPIGFGSIEYTVPSLSSKTTLVMYPASASEYSSLINLYTESFFIFSLISYACCSIKLFDEHTLITSLVTI
jgi:hypothetical protein